MGARNSRVLHRSLRETPPKAIGGDGVWLIAEDGRRILDASGGAAVSCLGHQHPRVLAAISRQASKLAYAHTSFFSSEPAEALADRLVGDEPGGLAYAYFVSGGSEAIEASIKLARQYFIESGQPQRQRFIARRQSYHGNTLGALAAGGNAWRREPYAPLLSAAFSHVTPAFAYHEKRDSESEADFVARLAADLEAEFRRLGPDTVAAFIAEPVMGAGGVIVPPEGYFEKIAAVCAKHDVYMVADEVICGFGRLGTMFGSQALGFRPDGMSLAKALSSGYVPIAAVMVPEPMYQALLSESRKIGTFGHGFTYSGHPVAAAVALKTLEIYERDRVMEQAAAKAPQFMARLRALGEHPIVGEVRGIGLIGGVELVADKRTKRSFDRECGVGARCVRFAEDNGLIVRAVAGDVVSICPPLVIAPQEIDELFDLLGRALDQTLDWAKRERLLAA